MPLTATMIGQRHRLARSSSGSLVVSGLLAWSALVWACSSPSPGPGDGGSGTTATQGGGNSAKGGNAASEGGSDEAGGNDAVGGANGMSGAAGDGSGGTNGTSGSNGVGGNLIGAAGFGATGTSLCSNGLDDDEDGLVDGFDPECTGPLDQDEGSFATGIPGDNRDPKWQDCFFDGNSGSGNDGCRYATGCLTGELSADDSDCIVTKQCIAYCAPLAQNGCDCFGCCSVHLEDGSTLDILESPGCSLANIDDETACNRCTKSSQCENTCGECELCAGKTVADLPASCSPSSGSGGSGNTSGGAGSVGGATGSGGSSAGGNTSQGGVTGSAGAPPAWTCDGGAQVCGPGLPACANSGYCSLGCCTPPPR